MIHLSDGELIAAARAGRPLALREIIRRHQQVVRQFLRRLSNDSATADDLAQEVFLAGFSGLDAFRGEASLRSWLCGIAYRKYHAELRSAGRRANRENRAYRESAQASLPLPLSTILDVRTAVAALPLEQRAVVVLCLGSDLSHSEAAAALGIPLGTVKSRLASAKRTLALHLKDYR